MSERIPKEERHALRLLQRRSDALSKVREKYDGAIEAAKEAAKATCTHSQTFSTTYMHDNGYGMQTFRPKLECRVCGKINLWGPTATWISQEQLRD